MIELPLYQIDAFTDRVFAGNPAAVCPLGEWLPDATMQAIAAENNLAETAFFVPEAGGDYRLRWFTPTVEVELCGHATLAAGFLVLTRLAPGAEMVRFATRSGALAVARAGEILTLDLPSDPVVPVDPPENLLRGLGVRPRETHRGRNYLAVFETEEMVRSLDPRMEALAGLFPYGVITSAPGREVDFVSRYFAPAHGVPEDPVTGSAHCALTPYWARRLGKARLEARQVSARGGALTCEDRGTRTRIGGRAALYLEGRIFV